MEPGDTGERSVRPQSTHRLTPGGLLRLGTRFLAVSILLVFLTLAGLALYSFWLKAHS